MHPPTCRVSEVPELIGLICSDMEHSHLAKLLMVSRSIFYCVAPLIWKNVSGITRLLSLLPSLDLNEQQLLNLNVSCHVLILSLTLSHVIRAGHSTL